MIDQTMAITDIHIQNGSKHSSGCPMVLALEENGYPNCRVDQDSILIVIFKGAAQLDDVFKFQPSLGLAKWMARHDKGEKVQPFNLHLNFDTKQASMRTKEAE